MPRKLSRPNTKMREKIGIIGFGNMGSAIAERLKADYEVWVFDKDKEKTKNILGLGVAKDITDLVEKVDTIILAVKPQDLTTVFNTILEKRKKGLKDKLVISIAAGIRTAFIEVCLRKTRVIRAMPNLPARFGEGMISLCKGRYAKKNDLDFTRWLFKKLGKVLILKEKMMDESTAISGSGPGYFYDWAEGKSIKDIKNTAFTFASSLTTTAEELGFSYPVARILAETTTEGSILYLEETKLSPSEAKKQVASRGGTTEAGLKVLHKGGSLTEAAKAALKRGRELVKFIKVG